MVKIIIADPVHSDAIEMLKKGGYEVFNLSNEKDRLEKELLDADALIVRSATKVTKDLIDKAQNLRIIGRSGVGLDNIDLAACEKRQIQVVNSPEGPTNSVAELALLFLLACARKLYHVAYGTKLGKWPKKTKGTELADKTLGIIGTGAIGGRLAKFAITLGMSVIAYDIIEYEELKRLENFKFVDLETLLSHADAISIHVPLVKSTRHMIDHGAFQKMKDNVIIVNTSRGGVIDEDALLQAINEGKVSGAGLDVYETEPVVHSSELVQHPLVITTPHIGAQTNEASRKNSYIVCEKIMNYLK